MPSASGSIPCSATRSSKALEANRYNKTAAARQLGLTLRALRYRMQKLGMD